MIPTNRSLVPLSLKRGAAMQAIADVEQKLARKIPPYARAFFRFLMDSKRVTLKEVHVFCPWLQESDFRGENSRGSKPLIS